MLKEGEMVFCKSPRRLVTVFFKKPFLSIKIALQCVKGTPWKAASHKTDIRIVEEPQQSRQEESEVTVVKEQNNLYLGKIGLQVHVKNKNSN